MYSLERDGDTTVNNILIIITVATLLYGCVSDNHSNSKFNEPCIQYHDHAQRDRCEHDPWRTR